MKTLGRHILVEFYDCDAQVMDDLAAVKRSMVEAANKAQCTVIGEIFHKFTPQGVSGAVVIAESHLAIHTWPEYRFAAVDLFTCGDVDPWVGFHHLRECFKAQRMDVQEIKRGHAERIGVESLQVKPAVDPTTGEILAAPVGNRLPPLHNGPLALSATGVQH